MKFLNNQTGYSLIEILTVVAIIALLSSILIVTLNPSKRRKDARNAQRAGDLDALRNAIVKYNIDNGSASLLDITSDSKYYILGTYGTTGCNFSCRNSITTESVCTDIRDFGAAGELGPRHDLWDSNLVSVWHLNESAGAIVDSKGSLNGTYTGVSYGQTGKVNTALDFDGTDDKIGLGTGNALSTGLTDFSISAWVMIDISLGSTDTNYEIISNESFQNFGYLVKVEDTTSSATAGKISFQTNQSGAYTQVSAVAQTYPNDQKWHHISVTKNGSVGKIYLDGVEVATGALNNPVDSTSETTIGGLSAQRWNGLIDEVAFFNDSLTATEAKSLYQNNIEDYINPLPFDPTRDSSEIASSGWDSDRTGYWIKRSSSGKIEIGACEPSDPENDGTYPEIKVSIL